MYNIYNAEIYDLIILIHFKSHDEYSVSLTLKRDERGDLRPLRK